MLAFVRIECTYCAIRYTVQGTVAYHKVTKDETVASGSTLSKRLAIGNPRQSRCYYETADREFAESSQHDKFRSKEE